MAWRLAGVLLALSIVFTTPSWIAIDLSAGSLLGFGLVAIIAWARRGTTP